MKQDDYLGPFLGIIFLAFLVAAIGLGIFLAVPLAIGVAIVMAVYLHYRGPNAKAKQIEAETRLLYEQALAATPLTLEDFSALIEAQIDDERLIALAMRLYDDEGFRQPDPPPPNSNSIEGGRYRDQLHKYIAATHSPERAERFVNVVLSILRPLDRPVTSGTFAASRSRSPEEIEQLIIEFYGDDDFFRVLRKLLDQNLNEQNGVMPSEYKGTNCAWDYLKDTPLLPLEFISASADWNNPENHTLILAGSGAGKTTLFKHLIAHLMKEDCCVIVMDSQSQLIEELAHLELADDELTWITPEHPLALNPFEADKADLADESFVNNAIGQLEFVINKLMDAPMTPRQRTLFHHTANLVLTIPNGNIQTFFAVLADPTAFSAQIDRLDKTTQRFFYEELKSVGKKGSPYDSTKTELSYRLDALLKNPTLRRIFNTNENTFQFYREMLKRRLILIDTSLALLAGESATFGRFMIAQALQACYRRVKAKATSRPVIFFIDEAHEYFDEKLETMLLQARKANVGMVIATQDLARASRAGIADTMLGSTTTKIVSRLVTGDARRLAPSMKTTAEFLMGLDDHCFGFTSGREPAVSIKAEMYPFKDARWRKELDDLREQMIIRYGPMEEDGEYSVVENSEGDSKENDTADQDGSDVSADDETGAKDDVVDEQAGESDQENRPTGNPAKNRKSKADPDKPAHQSTMDQNGDDDIEPADTL